MKSNLGKMDRMVRLVVATLIIILYAMGTISGTVAIVLGVVAGIFLLTSMVNFCPLYKALGISTKK
jgi:hypothetical protein